MKNSVLFLFSIIVVLFLSSCQEDSFIGSTSESPQIQASALKRTCSSTEHTHKLLEDPSYAKFHRQKLQRIEKMKSFKSADCTIPSIIPVAVHYQGLTGNTDASCLRSLAIQQIDVLNKDFSATNSDISKWNNEAAQAFPGILNGSVCVQFAIANKNHPTGFGLTDGQPAITINKTNSDQENQWAGYLNIYIQSGTGALGYAPFGGSGNGDGVVIDASAFGAGLSCGSIGSQAPYDLGRTTTHEVGHYLFLDHMWGENGGCSSDDGVSDTPNATDANYDCPTLGVASCNSTDMHMNYMDYTNDACMYMFSAGQASRMSNYITSSLSALTNNASNVVDGAISPGNDDDQDNNDDDTDDNTDDNSDGDNDEEEPIDETDNSTDECQIVTIKITLDEYGSETSWRVKNDANQVIAEGGPYEDGARGIVVEEYVCLDEGCYFIVIKDSFGDGICCEFGEGKVEILDESENIITSSDGYFGRRDQLIVCNDDDGLYRKVGSKDKKSLLRTDKKKSTL